MFRDMRRFKQALTEKECIEILNNNTNGVLALSGDEGYPYAVPLSYVYFDGCIYFHSASEGHKIDSIKRNGKASFCVVAEDNIVPEKFTTYFKSVIAFGRVELIEDEKEKINTLMLLAKKYSPCEAVDSVKKEIDGSLKRVKILKFNIEHLSGKCAIEMLKK